MNIVVTGRHCTVGEDLRDLVEHRLSSIAKLKDRVIRSEVEFSAMDANKNPSDAVEVQITVRSRGPVIRAEARGNDKAQAFEQAFDRLMAQLRKAADRRKTHRGLRTVVPVAEAPAVAEPDETLDHDTHEVAGLVVTGDGPLVVREKVFRTVPLTLAQALDEMELVGHDFFLYQDATSGRPSVVYRRKAYNYGVIQMDLEE